MRNLAAASSLFPSKANATAESAASGILDGSARSGGKAVPRIRQKMAITHGSLKVNGKGLTRY
jgi:hypothetical protein